MFTNKKSTCACLACSKIVNSCLVTFFRLSADLDLPKFVEHYWKEFPTMCHMSVEKAKTDQVDPKILQILDKKSLDGIPPPCIFETLQNIIKKIPLKAPFPILPEVTSRYPSKKCHKTLIF